MRSENDPDLSLSAASLISHRGLPSTSSLEDEKMEGAFEGYHSGAEHLLQQAALNLWEKISRESTGGYLQQVIRNQSQSNFLANIELANARTPVSTPNTPTPDRPTTVPTDVR
jgi:hypothetical protein